MLLSLYSKFGLYTAIKNYNGNSDFNYFANLYVIFELNKALTHVYSSSIFQKKKLEYKVKKIVCGRNK